MSNDHTAALFCKITDDTGIVFIEMDLKDPDQNGQLTVPAVISVNYTDIDFKDVFIYGQWHEDFGHIYFGKQFNN